MRTIQGEEKLKAIFGVWPSFHDAEVWSLAYERDADGLSVVAVIHAFQMTSEVDARGYYVLKNHAKVRIRFDRCSDVSLDGFNHQNVLFGPLCCPHVPVPFTLTLKQGWFGRFTGTVLDDATRGMPGTGAVEGCFSFPRVEFTKQMPVCYVAAPDGRSITLREFLIEQRQNCERDVPHMPIFYRGEFSDARHVSGIWTIRGGPLSLLDGRAIQMPESTGRWTKTRPSEAMNRMSDCTRCFGTWMPMDAAHW